MRKDRCELRLSRGMGAASSMLRPIPQMERAEREEHCAQPDAGVLRPELRAMGLSPAIVGY